MATTTLKYSKGYGTGAGHVKASLYVHTSDIGNKRKKSMRLVVEMSSSPQIKLRNNTTLNGISGELLERIIEEFFPRGIKRKDISICPISSTRIDVFVKE